MTATDIVPLTLPNKNSCLRSTRVLAERQLPRIAHPAQNRQDFLSAFIEPVNSPPPGFVRSPVRRIVGLGFAALERETECAHGEHHFRDCVQPDVSKNALCSSHLLGHRQYASPLQQPNPILQRR